MECVVLFSHPHNNVYGIYEMARAFRDEGRPLSFYIARLYICRGQHDQEEMSHMQSFGF